MKVLAVIKNEPGTEWGQEVRIDHEPGKNGVPHDQECTVYLEVSQKLKGRPWALLGGGADVGVSHVGKQAPAPATGPSAGTDTFEIKCRKPEDRVNVALADGNATFRSPAQEASAVRRLNGPAKSGPGQSFCDFTFVGWSRWPSPAAR